MTAPWPFSQADWDALKAEQAADTLSTSARLSLTEQRLTETERERDSLARRCAVRFDEAEKLRAELVSARQEIEQLRAEADLGREARQRLVAARPTPHLDAVKAELASARVELELWRTNSGELYAYDALYCTTCYGRFLLGTDVADNHPHPLIPVRVSITHRTEGPTE